MREALNEAIVGRLRPSPGAGRASAGERREAGQRGLGRERGARLAKASERPGQAQGFEPVTRLAIMEEEKA